MKLNKLTLSFPEKEEELFLKQYYFDSILQVRVAFILLTFLYGIFGYLDSLMFPEYARIFHIIRFLFVVPVLSLVFLLSFAKFFRKIWQVLLLICFIIGGTGISLMIMYVPENFAYYGGMMLVFSAGYFFIKLRFFFASIAGWTTLLLFNIGAIFYAYIPNLVLVNYNFFFISANIIGMFAAYNIEYYARRNFFLTYELDNEKLFVEEINKNLENVVEERTRELLVAKENAEVSKANVTAIIEGTQDSIWAFNRNYEILYINKAFQEEFKKTFGVWLEPGVSLIESLPEALQPIWKPRYDRVLRNDQFKVEDAIESEFGVIYVQVSFNPIVKDGEVVGGSCIGNNITHQKLVEIELQRAKEKAEESETKFKGIIQQINDGIIVFDEQKKIVVWNKGAESIFGIKADYALNNSIVDFRHQFASPPEKNKESIESEISNLVTLSTPEVFYTITENEVAITSEQFVNLQSSVFPIKFDNYYLFCYVFRDTTKLKGFEKQLVQLNSNKDQFISILAHDLRSPFNGMLGILDLLHENIREYDLDIIESRVAIVQKIAQQTFNLLEDLLLWSHAQSGSLSLELEEVDLLSICEEVKGSLANLAEEKNIKVIITDLANTMFKVDVNTFKTILRNLISNAIKFSQKNGQIKISSYKQNSSIVFSVSDQGVGIAPDRIVNLFDITQKNTTEGTSGEQGTGLGLHLCKELVGKHKGEIWVESEVGKGSDFRFSIPLVQDSNS